jgi:monovalent cation/hydrogen antiporter
MALFESMLTLLVLAILLLQVSRRFSVPYPTMLAAAGLCVAALPWAPDVSLDPHLVLVLFIAPAILDAAFEFPLRAMRRYWIPLFAFAVVLVVVTTAAVAWAGVALGGMPLAAAVVLGAIVSPPDAAAASAMLNRPTMPHATATVLKGESLLNDAVALLIFTIGVRIGTAGGSVATVLPQLALAIPGGIVLGVAIGRLGLILLPPLAGTLGGVIAQFVVTFATWLIADRLGLSAILAVVAVAMTVAHYGGGATARDRLHSNAIWAVVVFVLNVFAFLLVGLEARAIMRELDPGEIRHALVFAGEVLAVVIVTRVVAVMTFNKLARHFYVRAGRPAPTKKQGIVASWCGMRGMVTLAAALALPEEFPSRGLIVLSALAVVIGTLVLQGATLEPLVRALRFPVDSFRDDEFTLARGEMSKAAAALLESRDDLVARAMRWEFRIDAATGEAPTVSADEVRIEIIGRQRDALRRLRREGRIEDETYRRLEQDLDLIEVASSRGGTFDLVDT